MNDGPLSPDWRRPRKELAPLKIPDKPIPTDAPTDEQQSALAAVYAVSRTLPEWLAVAATSQVPARRWRELVYVLTRALVAAMRMDDDPVTEYTLPRITIYPHEVQPDPNGERCGRCGLAVDDEAHDRDPR